MYAGVPNSTKWNPKEFLGVVVDLDTQLKIRYCLTLEEAKGWAEKLNNPQAKAPAEPEPQFELFAGL